MTDFKRKTAVMPDFPPNPSTISLSQELDEVGDLQCRTLALILKQLDCVDQRTNWACTEIMQLNHVQSQLIRANNDHAEKIDGLERRELRYKTELSAYVKFLCLIGTAISVVAAWAIAIFAKH